VDQNDPRRFVFVEHWVDKNAQHKHDSDSEHIRHFKERGSSNVEKVEIFYQLDRIA
jgi:quinol monooxygenase YgiN